MKLYEPKRKNFSAEENQILFKHNKDAPFELLLKMFSGRTKGTIINRANTLGLKKQEEDKKIWKDEESERLSILYSNSTKEELMQEFPDCNWDMIVDKAQRMGVKQRNATEIREFDENGKIVKKKSCADCGNFLPLEQFNKSKVGVGTGCSK